MRARFAGRRAAARELDEIKRRLAARVAWVLQLQRAAVGFLPDRHVADARHPDAGHALRRHRDAEPDCGEVIIAGTLRTCCATRIEALRRS